MFKEIQTVAEANERIQQIHEGIAELEISNYLDLVQCLKEELEMVQQLKAILVRKEELGSAA